MLSTPPSSSPPPNPQLTRPSLHQSSNTFPRYHPGAIVCPRPRRLVDPPVAPRTYYTDSPGIRNYSNWNEGSISGGISGGGGDGQGLEGDGFGRPKTPGSSEGMMSQRRWSGMLNFHHPVTVGSPGSGSSHSRRKSSLGVNNNDGPGSVSPTSMGIIGGAGGGGGGGGGSDGPIPFPTQGSTPSPSPSLQNDWESTIRGHPNIGPGGIRFPRMMGASSGSTVDGYGPPPMGPPIWNAGRSTLPSYEKQHDSDDDSDQEEDLDSEGGRRVMMRPASTSSYASDAVDPTSADTGAPSYNNNNNNNSYNNNRTFSPFRQTTMMRSHSPQVLEEFFSILSFEGVMNNNNARSPSPSSSGSVSGLNRRGSSRVMLGRQGSLRKDGGSAAHSSPSPPSSLSTFNNNNNNTQHHHHHHHQHTLLPQQQQPLPPPPRSLTLNPLPRHPNFGKMSLPSTIPHSMPIPLSVVRPVPVSVPIAKANGVDRDGDGDGEEPGVTKEGMTPLVVDSEDREQEDVGVGENVAKKLEESLLKDGDGGDEEEEEKEMEVVTPLTTEMEMEIGMVKEVVVMNEEMEEEK